MKRLLPVLVLFIVAIFAWLQSGYRSSNHSAIEPRTPNRQAKSVDKFPYLDAERIREINKTLERIRSGDRKFKQDGAIFRNAEGLLPEKSQDYYREYTVITPGTENRGARRIVQGRQGETYYSDDHYRSFITINSNGVP